MIREEASNFLAELFATKFSGEPVITPIIEIYFNADVFKRLPLSITPELQNLSNSEVLRF
mgnify:CR=1 FL=1